MTTRERKAVAAAAIVVLAFVLLQFLLLPLWDESQRLQNGIASQKRQLAAMQESSRHSYNCSFIIFFASAGASLSKSMKAWLVLAAFLSLNRGINAVDRKSVV